MKSSQHYTRFRDALRQIREEAGLSQSDLAQKLGKPQTFVSKSELGERRVDFVEALEICAACRITIHQFAQLVGKGASCRQTIGPPKRSRPRKWTAACR